MEIHKKSRSIFGHDDAKMILAQAINLEKIFPTWIFVGPLGVGKSTLAHQFAKCLLSGYDANAHDSDKEMLYIPDDHPIHRLVELRIHPDFFILEQRNESISIDETRELFSKIHMTPSLAKWRIVILENASNLNKNICNSLLKVLEEPPKNTVVILICNNTVSLPKTLLSRAAKINFSALDNGIVIQALKNQGIKNADTLAQLSNGSIGFAHLINKNNGIEIYKNILNGFHANGKNHQILLKNIIENKLCDNFFTIKEFLLDILRKYVSFLCGLIENISTDEQNVFESIVALGNINIDYEIKKILAIIERLNKCESAMLDRNAVLVESFQNFFNE